MNIKHVKGVLIMLEDKESAYFSNLLGNKGEYMMREFMQRYEGVTGLFVGRFKNYIRLRNKTNIYATDCAFIPEDSNSNIQLGHMVWQNIINFHDYDDLKLNAIVYIRGTVNRYHNERSDNPLCDQSLPPDHPLYRYSIGVKDCTITSADNTDFVRKFVK